MNFQKGLILRMKRFALLNFLILFVALVNAQFTITSTNDLCFGGRDGSAQVSPSSGYLYHWNNGDSTAMAGGLSVGTYTCTVLNLQNVALDTLSAVIRQPDSIAVELTIVKASCPNSRDGSIAVLVEGGVPPNAFDITKNFIDFLSDTDGLFTHLDSGLYNIMVTDRYGCVVIDTAFVGFSSNICTSVNDIPQLLSFILQPNPSTDVTHITYELNEPLPLKISIYDLSGKKVQEVLNETEAKGVHTQSISLNSLATGNYILNVVSDKGSFNIKLVKE